MRAYRPCGFEPLTMSQQKRKASEIDEPVEKKRINAGAESGSAAAPAADTSGSSAGANKEWRVCPYLDTINRRRLDFDLTKQCSVSLLKQNVYVCLICGGYFQGRGRDTHANSHSFQAGHHVFINLRTQKFYCLPDNYEVHDSSLQDIQRALDPVFTPSMIRTVDEKAILSQDVFGVRYLPGFIGLNNLKHTDFISVVVQALTHVKDLRDFFLDPTNYSDCSDDLVIAFAELVRKVWSPMSFKSSVAPHEFVNWVSRRSKKKFQPGVQSHAIEFLSWLLNKYAFPAVTRMAFASRAPFFAAFFHSKTLRCCLCTAFTSDSADRAKKTALSSIVVSKDKYVRCPG